MTIGRTLPPAAPPLCWRDLAGAIGGLCHRRRSMQTLEAEIKERFGVRHVTLVSSGTAALALTLSALRSLSSRTRVVIPAYTCFSVPAAVLTAGLQPVLCDVDANTFDFDRAKLEPMLDDSVLAVVAHHLFGVPSDVNRLRAICRARGIFVVEDAAQAMGIKRNGHELGTLGDAGIFSLGRGKHITCGSGGIIVTNRARVANAIERAWQTVESPSAADVMRDFIQLVLLIVFIRPALYWIPSALPFLRLGQTIFPAVVRVRRLSGMHAGFLHHWRTRLGESNQIRSATIGDFSRRLSLPLRYGAPLPYLRLPIFTRTAADRDRVYTWSRVRGLGMSLAYPSPVSDIPEIRALFEGQTFPTARRVAERLLTIPTHHWLSREDKDAIVECLNTPC